MRRAVPVCTTILLRECDVTLYAPLDSQYAEYIPRCDLLNSVIR